MDRFFNQSKIIDQKKIEDTSFVVIGAGAIGSFTVLGLSKMGAKKITVYDDDTLETHNFDSQFYPFSGVGKSKVDVLRDIAKDYGDVDIRVNNFRWDTEHFEDADIVLVCVDNMDVRKTIWDFYRTRNTRFFVEGRMSAQVYRVYGVDMANSESKDFYNTTLYPQSEASPAPCGEKSIIYTVLQVSAQMCSQVKRWLMNDYRPTEVQYDCYLDEVVKTYHVNLEEPKEEENKDDGKTNTDYVPAV